jgi:acetaldehyde dehydrogenase / alcohol dehydrogenase
MLGLGGSSREEKVIKLIEAVERLKAELDVPPTIREIVGTEKEAQYFNATLEMAYQAFDDQCTGANPRYPLVKDLRKMLEDAWTAPILPLNTLSWTSSGVSCLKSRGATESRTDSQPLPGPSTPAGTGAA